MSSSNFIPSTGHIPDLSHRFWLVSVTWRNRQLFVLLEVIYNFDFDVIVPSTVLIELNAIFSQMKNPLSSTRTHVIF